MKLTRKQIYVVIIAVGLVALIIDRAVMSGGPARAKGAVSANSKSEETAASKSTEQKIRIGIPDFPQAQTDIGSLGSDRDPFQMTETAKSALMPTPEPERAEKGEQSTVQPFEERHVLSAVISVGKSRMAIVDDHISLAVGQAFDGCVITEITDRSVTVTCADEDLMLRLSGPMERERNVN